MEVIPRAPETSVQSLTASSSQSLTVLGHHFENIAAGENARLHLGNVYEEVHNHFHDGEGKQRVTEIYSGGLY